MITKKTIIAFLVCVFLLGGGVFGVLYLKNRPVPEKQPDVKEIEVVPTQADNPTSTPTPELKRDELKLEVLNGAGTPGLAGEAQDFLEGLGYKNIKTGNADSYDYKTTELSVKPDMEKYLDLIAQDLDEKYTVESKSSDLDEKSDYDVRIILGKE